MALTQAQWYEKLKNLIPRHVFEEEVNNKAIFNGIAKCLAAAQTNYEDYFRETNISVSDTKYLEEHADERSVVRQSGETDSSFQLRVRNIKNKSNKPALKTLIDQLLITGESIIIEDWAGGSFCDREYFCSRHDIIIDEIKDAFSVIIDKQVIVPDSFCDREDFSDRENFVGTNQTPASLYTALTALVNENRAFGCLYRVIERSA